MEFMITETDENFAHWLAKSFLSETTKQLLANVDVLIVPEENFRQYHLPVFQRNTLEILDYLKLGLKVEVAIDDESFREVALNNRITNLGSI